MNNNYCEILENIKIYYINLDRAIERKINIEKFLIPNNIPFKRISAIDGNTLDENELAEKYIFNGMSIFEIACLFSHLKAMEEILKDNLDYAIIMEDDCNFDYFKYKNIKIKDLVKINNDWDVIQLAITTGKQLSKKISNIKTILTKRTNDLNPEGAIAYLINKNAIIKLLNHFTSCNKIKVSDVYIFENTNTYFTTPYFSYYSKNEFKSYIRDNGSYKLQHNSKIFWDNYYLHNNEN
jgi:GR25 family glycosyltransferase involved in LPS biosynthesis